jgi:hypothetical protein
MTQKDYFCVEALRRETTPSLMLIFMPGISSKNVERLNK